ncbi:DUF2075 domain-containing protein, partial [Bifidobacterium pseudocatenulatum]|uniref:DNA/RNA helicase domain-containing protein n=1 Tax=Bifidobacterium pseudocatenulatum TaxID=28026 RepID=UPI001EDC4212
LLSNYNTSQKVNLGLTEPNEKASCNKRAVSKRNGSISYAQSNLRNELNVLLKRGVHGLYLFAVDPELQAALKEAASK